MIDKSELPYGLQLFSSPTGDIRPITPNKADKYSDKYKKLGMFWKQPYDLDICQLYRQMEDLKGSYTIINGIDFAEYVETVKGSVVALLKSKRLPVDFYLNHFYYVLKPNHPSYPSFVNLFLALSDPLKLVPILEFQLQQYYLWNKDIDNPDEFYNSIEFQVCAFLRSNHFPEDYHYRHEKILNWLYFKEQINAFEESVDEKLNTLISILNKVSKMGIPEGMMGTLSAAETIKQPEVKVVEEYQKILFEDIKGYFHKSCHETLKMIISGQAVKDERILFIGYGNQLIDVFRIYAEDKKITGNGREIYTWIRKHFMYFNPSIMNPDFFSNNNPNVIYGGDLPNKQNRIPLTGLKKERFLYYKQKNKPPKTTP